MDADEARRYCLAKPGTWADWPWGGGDADERGDASSGGHEHPVIKVGEPPAGGKIFAFLGADGVGVKAGASRDVADEWLARYPGDATVMPYIGRSGWNNLSFRGAIPDEELLEAVDESYRLVVGRLPRKHRPAGWDAGA